MRPLRSIWLALPPFLCACSFLNAPAELGDTTTGTAGTAGTTTTGGSAGTGGTNGGSAGTGAGGTMGGTAGTAGSAGTTSTPGCGDGTVDPGEECDDMKMGDTTAPGDQDYCTDACKFKEFDVEAGLDAMSNNVLPVVGFRDEGGVSTFYVLWYSTSLSRILGRQYAFDGKRIQKPVCADNGTSCMNNSECCSAQCTNGSCAGMITCLQFGTACQQNADCCSQKCISGLCSDVIDISTTPNPDPGGERLCTADSQRSLIFWREKSDVSVYARKIESNGVIFDAVSVGGPSDPSPSCAAGANGTFVEAMTSKAGMLYNVLVQPFTSFAVPNGAPIDIGDATGPSKTSSWPLSMGYLVSWVVDPANNTPLTAQLLDKDGKLQTGFIYQLSDIGDGAPRDPWGERIGKQDQFAFAYTRDSAPDGMGITHREVALRLFQAPDMGSMPIQVSMDPSPQAEPRIGVNPTSGKFVVVWTGGMPGSENIQMRAFDPMGKDVLPETTVNETLLGQQTAPSVAVDPVSGDVVVVWDNYLPNSGKPHKVTAKIFAGLLK